MRPRSGEVATAAGALGAGGGGDGRDVAAFDGDGDRVGGRGGARGDGQTGGSADGGQGFAPETEGVDADEMVIGEFGGGVTQDGEGEFVGGHAESVIGDLDTVDAAAGNGDRDAGRAGVERVFNEFAGRRGRTFDDFAGGDAVDGAFGEQADAAGCCGGAHAPPSSRKRAMRAVVEGSCWPAADWVRLGRMPLARILPSSTPH